MVCPYCSHKNPSSALVCQQCGILLHLGKTTRHAPSSGGGLSFMRGFLPGQRLKSRHAALQARVEEMAAKTQERAEVDLQNPAQAPAARLRLAVLYLLNGEIEKSVHWFQQARQMGGGSPEFYNNAGITLARRGTLPQAAEMFEQAAKLGADKVAPGANLAHLFIESGAEPDPAQAEIAIGHIQRALRLEPKNATLYNRLGLILCRERRYDEAAVQFRQALAMAGAGTTVCADSQNNVGLALCLSGDVAGATAAFDAAVEMDPAHAHALTNAALARLISAPPTAAEMDKLSRAARMDPAGAAVRADYGYGLCQSGAVNDGILELKEAVSLSSHLFESCYNLGKVYADGEATDIAERYLARALQLSPRSVEALLGVGVIKLRQKLIPQAVTAFQTALRTAPNLALARINLGLAQGLAGEFTDAALQFSKAAQLDPKDAHAPAQAGWLQLRQENLTAGMNELAIAAKLDEHLPEVQNNYGVCYISLGKPELAVPCFKRALDLNPEFHAVHYQWGYALASQKLQDSALREWDLSTKYEPTNPDSYSNRGVIYYQQGKIEDAIAEFRHVIVLRETRMEDYSNLGLAFAKSGLLIKTSAKNPADPRMKQALEKHKHAIDMFDRALKLDPRNVMLHSNRGLACFFASMPEEAMKEWGLVSTIDPAYARRRGKRQQSEYDDSQIALVPFSVPDRAALLAPRTGGFLPRFLAGYDADEWEYLLSDPELTQLSNLRQELMHLDRELAALAGK